MVGSIIKLLSKVFPCSSPCTMMSSSKCQKFIKPQTSIWEGHRNRWSVNSWWHHKSEQTTSFTETVARLSKQHGPNTFPFFVVVNTYRTLPNSFLPWSRNMRGPPESPLQGPELVTWSPAHNTWLRLKRSIEEVGLGLYLMDRSRNN